MSFWDARDHFYAFKEEHSGDPRGFTNDSRAAFIKDWILTSPALQGAELGAARGRRSADSEPQAW